MANPTLVTSGPGQIIDGPVPQKPAYTLLDAAKLVIDQDERWLNGVAVRGFPPDVPSVYDWCNPGSGKVTGAAAHQPEFSAYTVYVAETCSAYLGSQDDFAGRAETVLDAVQSYAVEYEFYSGTAMTLSPYLMAKLDATGHVTSGSDVVTVYPNGNTVTKPRDALGYLENAIAATGRQGMIHCSPAMLNALLGLLVVKQEGTLMKTINGTTIVPGYGYAAAIAAGAHPAGRTAPTAVTEWMVATGPVEYRQSEIFINPPELWMAMDRTNNAVTYRAERHIAVDWDTAFKAAVLADWTA